VKLTATPLGTLSAYVTTVKTREGSRKTQTNSHTTCNPVSCGIYPEKRIKYSLKQNLRDTLALI
jgi:hypothetical protein